MLSGGGSGSECDSENYLQFGRDILFVTTHLSQKLCYNHTVIDNRQYVEIEVTFYTIQVFSLQFSGVIVGEASYGKIFT